jgi:sulfide:quinone oxidoreductase
MTTFRKLTDDFYVAPQLDPPDFAEAAAMGIRTVINNRPDGEAPDQLSDEEAAALADTHGLAYAHVPVVSGNLRLEDIALMRAAIAGNDGPYLAYCRSGTRSCHLWALAEAAKGEPDQLIETAARAGYDLHGMRPFLKEIRQRGDS